ncbi:MAG: hypothetical protein IJ767_04220 [Bacteroidaceae bacterium]|nr:hypothetical protein [Bacteroidaceae bacterium]
MISERDRERLDAIPLEEIMRLHGYFPRERTKSKKGRQRLFYRCPNPRHPDNDPSFCVDVHPNTDGIRGFHCFGCNEVNGVGAIQLHAYLIGKDWKKDYGEVCEDLARRMHITLNGTWVADSRERTGSMAPQKEARWEPCDDEAPEWTPNALRALGCQVREVTRSVEGRERDGDDVVSETVMHEDGKPALRYSWDARYYRKDCPPDNFDPSVIERIFHVRPVREFVCPGRPVEKGGVASAIVRSADHYPIFVFHYEDERGWFAKKYEPYFPKIDGRKYYKWTWWFQDDRQRKDELETVIYGDNDVWCALHGAPVRSSDPKGHPDVLTGRTDEKGNEIRRFQRLVICSGPRDAMNVYFHSDAHVAFFHSEQVGINSDGTLEGWLIDALRRLTRMAVEVYILFDMDRIGQRNSRLIALENPYVKWVQLPAEMVKVTDPQTGAPCKDVTDYFVHFHEIMRAMPARKRSSNPNRHFAGLLKTAKPMKFWIEKYTTTGKQEGGREPDVRYQLDVNNMAQFLSANGVCYSIDEAQKPNYILMEDNIYSFIPTGRKDSLLLPTARRIMKDWLVNHPDYYTPTLANSINTAKGLTNETIAEIDRIEIRDHSWGYDFDHLFFANGAVRVKKDEIKILPYTQVSFHVNERQIIQREFSLINLGFTIEKNPDIEKLKERHEEILANCHTADEKRAEAARWNREENLWSYLLKMERPFDEMPVHFRLIYNMGRIFWRKEKEGRELDREEKQMQDMQFINKMAALGFIISRYRTRAAQQMVLATDYSVQDESKSCGGNGKSLLASLIHAVRPGIDITGKNFKISPDTIGRNFSRFERHIHSFVVVDDLRTDFKSEILFNLVSRVPVKNLFHDEILLDVEESPKMFVTSNQPFDVTDPSTFRRIFPVLVADYYHPASVDGSVGEWTPKMEFGVKDLTDNLDDKLWNELANLLAVALQFHLQTQRVIMPPVEGGNMDRIIKRAIKDWQFVDWANEFFAEEKEHHYGRPIAHQEECISFLDFLEERINTATLAEASTRIRTNIRRYCQLRRIIRDPEVVLTSNSAKERNAQRCKGWVTVLNDKDEPTMPRRRVLLHTTCHYYYQVGKVPATPEEVLPATETDLDS